jgi:hypothetical protein
LTELISLDLKVVPSLQVDLKALARAEVLGQPKSGVCTDPTIAVNDLVDAARRDTNRDAHVVLGDSKWLEEVRHQDLAGMDRWHRDRHRCSSE